MPAGATTATPGALLGQVGQVAGQVGQAATGALSNQYQQAAQQFQAAADQVDTQPRGALGQALAARNQQALSDIGATDVVTDPRDPNYATDENQRKLAAQAGVAVMGVAGAPAAAIAGGGLARDATGLWYNAMLSSPHTVAVKTMSETLSLALAPAERLASAAIEKPLAALQGRPPERFFGEAPADVVGMVGGIREGVANALATLRTGVGPLSGEDYGMRGAFPGSPVASSVVNFPSRLLQAGVEMMGSIAQAGALNATAYRMAAREGLSGPALAQRMADLRVNPPPELQAIADKMAAYRTYQQKLGPFWQKLVEARNAADVAGIPVGRLIVPFAQTPINLMKYGLERSPLGALNVSMWQKAAAGNPEGADAIGKWVLGSGIASALALEVGAGNITGPPPQAQNERLAWEREGKQPYAVRIGDNWISVAKIPMLSQALLQVASIAKDAQAGKDVGTAGVDLAKAVGESLAQEPYVQGVASLLQAMNDPKQYGNNWLNSLASSAVPAGVRAVTQTMDPTRREATTPVEAIKAEIPGLSQQLLPRIGAFGETRQREASVVSPLPTTPAHVGPVDTELSKYGVEPGLAGQTLRGMDLTRAEDVAYQQASGQFVKQVLDQLIVDPRYKALSDLDKAAALQRAITRSKDVAARQYVGQLITQQGEAAIRQRIAAKKAATRAATASSVGTSP